ncbi:MAG: TonB-dependent receptor [Bacteroidales bacterium]|jgi:iron complex outermembrane receptor protein|nr:TonB-dependent receptor [Bacteroidales bacterium]
MTFRTKILFFAFLFFITALPIIVLSQNAIIKGTVKEDDTDKPIPFASIGIKDQQRGTNSDMDGNFQFEVKPGEYIIMFSSIGYEKISQSITAKAGKTVTLNIKMKVSVTELNTTVVSASKYEQKLEDATNSMEVIKPSMLENKNILTLDKAIESVPGVAIVDNEPQIRGGSGYSSGLGSRVMILIDEIPMMRADAGRPVWSFLPVEDVEQIEVLKGASSVTYGSSALNGAINIRTAYPKDKPLTRITLHSGIYSTPPRRYTKSWDGFNPIILGANFIHSRRVNNFDYVIGGNFLSDPGCIGAPPHDTTGDYDKGEFEKNIRLNFGTRVRSNHLEGLTYGLNGNFMYSQNTQAFFWMDADSNIFRSYPGAITNFADFQFYLDPYVKYFGPKGASHSLKNRFFYCNSGGSNDQSTMSYFVYNEYQFSKMFKTKIGDPVINVGVMNMYAYSYGKVFSGIFGEAGEKSSDNIAIYAQGEMKLFRRLTVSAGVRWEYYTMADYTDNKPIFRAGVNLKATNATYIRASFGQGFRFPSIGERYISTMSGNFGIYPNPDLKSETSWNTELGIKQLFKIKKFVGFIDICGFWQEYDNYVEFNAGLWGRNMKPDSSGYDISKNLGYKFLNTADARVWGIDITLMGEGKFTKDFSMTVMGGYTFTRPTSLEPDKIYYVDTLLQREFSYMNTSSDTRENILKYRFEQLAKLDMEFTYKGFSLGVSGKYYGFMYNIDNFFYENDRPGLFDTGIRDYRREHHDGDFVFDARLSYELKKHFKFTVLMNNILNTEYSLRPISVEPPRVTSIQIVYKV